jgi:hypothetical protein
MARRKRKAVLDGNIDVGGRKAKYCRMRLAEPTKFDPRSFRIHKIKKGTEVIIACPKGKWSPGKKKCKVGTKAQSLLKKKIDGRCPRYRAVRLYKQVV